MQSPQKPNLEKDVVNLDAWELLISKMQGQTISGQR